MTDLLFRRSAPTKIPDSKRYFNFQIGSYRDDFYLYFPKLPTFTQYKNEIFNKLSQFSGSEVTDYFVFHYERAAEKTEFTTFLLAELPVRIPQFIGKRSQNSLRLALDWAAFQRDQIIRPVTHISPSAKIPPTGTSDRSLDVLVDSIINSGLLKAFLEKLEMRTEKIMTSTEFGVRNMMACLETGSIVLNNRNHDEKVIQAFLLLQQVQAPVHVAKAEQVFKRFTAADIASILHLHFEGFRENKLNTIQRKVGDQLERLKPNHPKVMKLSEAFQDFFYS